jgi:two-component system nitrogen regulation response regulator NtrX
MRTILIVDDEKSIRQTLEGILQDEGFKTLTAETGENCLSMLKEENPDLILLDIWMPGIDGLETLKRIRDLNTEQMVLMMSGHGTIQTAVQATKLGAYDFIEKPLSIEKLLLSINNALKIGSLVEENRELKAQIKKDYEIIGESPPIQELKKRIELAAPTSGWVLITGDNGTGKELVARAIHANSLRKEKPFVEVNCAAIPEELIESTLFGHEKGAFTGATNPRKGKFDQAHEGTLFLDEIGDMSPKTQAKVLRILEEHRFERVGGSKTIQVDVRVIAATNKNLQEEIKSGNFRKDLFFRLNVLPLVVPPLRERNGDIPILANYFLEHFSEKEGKKKKIISEDAMEILVQYSWPGNVRELKNTIERLVIMTPNEIINSDHLGEYIFRLEEDNEKTTFSEMEGIPTYKDAKESFEKEFLIRKLQQHNWNISKTAEAIEMERSNLHRKIKTYNIDLKKPA